MTTLPEYKNKQFNDDLKSLKLKKPNSTILSNAESFGIDDRTLFFGGRNWSNLREDISGVKKENLEKFILSLFTMVSIDLTIYTYFKDSYPAFRMKTDSIKFGSCGFGPHFESPSKLLSVPEQKGIVSFEINTAAIGVVVDFFIEESKKAISLSESDIDIKDFLGKLLDDKQFRVGPDDNGFMFEAIYKELKQRL